MKLKELRKLVAAQPTVNDELEVQVWLPGSYIRLSGMFLRGTTPDKILIEGNIEPGSVLADDFDYESARRKAGL